MMTLVADSAFGIKRFWLGRQKVRRARLYCVGTAKSGTHSICSMFSSNVAAAHEPQASQLIEKYFDRREGVARRMDFAVAGLLVLVPVALIARQPDLGTALLVLAAGFFVIFFAGLPWIWLGAMIGGALALLPVAWMLMHDYQRNRILTLVDPMSDPLGKGFHTLQAMIAIGSGGVFGKGWMQGTQTHMEFIHERTSDFIFAVYSEEFGLVGNLLLLILFLVLVARALAIAHQAATPFTRLLASAIAMILFTFAFVNMAMVSGILPVVGVPLPFISYGGTSLVTLSLSIGMLMSIQHHRALVQT